MIWKLGIIEMKLKAARKWFSDKSTISVVYIDGKFFCYALEPVVRPAGEKIKGKTAIPWGTYPLVVTFSERFQKPLPLLIGVPNFVGVRIHAGNDASDTEGCLCLGLTHSTDYVGNSKLAMAKLMEKLYDAYDIHDQITIEIAAEATV